MPGSDADSLRRELRLVGAYLGPCPWRSPDVVDKTLDAMLAEMRHERRMEQIREIDVEAWAREQADISRGD
jgi:hypothetical protein